MRLIILFLGFFLVLNTTAQVQNLELLSTWKDNSLIPSKAHYNTYNEIWGFAINGHEYAVIGSTLGTHIIDVTDPANIQESFRIPGASQGDHIIHRDYHDYKGYLYCVSDESGSEKSTLQILDITQLPDACPVVYDKSKLIERAHNIFIDTIQSKLYVLSAGGGDTAYKAMKIYSLSDPLNPVKIGEYSKIGGISFGHIHDAYVNDDKAFLNAGNDGLFIVDFSTNPPKLIDRFSNQDYPQAGYNHSGWPTEDMKYYYFADENWGTDLKAVQVNDFMGAEILSTFDAGNDNPYSIAHNQIVHKNYLYVSYYFDGLQVYDLSNPEAPKRAYEYLTSKEAHAKLYRGSWGVYPFLPSGNILVSDMQEGLFVLKGINSSSNPTKVNKNEHALDIKIVPNPSDGQFKLQTKLAIQHIHIFDAQGKRVQHQFDGNSYRIPNKSSGIYFVQCVTKKQRFWKTLVID